MAPSHVPTKYLRAGDVGYICAAIKQVADARVGDTVTNADHPTEEPLPGYKKVQSMVYCGIYPAEGEKYEPVKDALEKLQVNDAAFEFEPETSAALGFGFRCGFLGLLHMEIIVERLEREFDLGVITTSPSVVYKIVKTDGTVEMIQNPTNLPDPAEIAHRRAYRQRGHHAPQGFCRVDHGPLSEPAGNDAEHGIHHDRACRAAL